MTSSVGATGAASTPVVQTGNRPSLGQVEFLTLLAAQLRYQSPLEPMSEGDMVAQLAQFSMLEELTQIRTIQQEQDRASRGMESWLISMSAVNLLGQKITATVHDEAQERHISGVVTAARWDGALGAEVRVGQQWIPWSALTGASTVGSDEDD